MGGSISLEVSLFCIAILFSAVFSGTEAAFLSIQRGKLAALAKASPATAQRIDQFASNPERLLATVLTGNNLTNTAAAVLGTSIVARLVSESFVVAVATIVVTVLLVVFAESIPKTVATRYPIRIAGLMALPLRIIEAVLLPPIWFLQRIVRAITATLGLPPANNIVTEDEIGAMIDLGRQSGSVEAKQAEMLAQVLRLGERQLSDIMTHRTDIVGVATDATLGSFLEIFRTKPHAHYPLFEGTIDNIVGVVKSDDILLSIANESLEQGQPVSGLSRTPLFLPWNKPIDQLFRQAASLTSDLLVLIDEYGGVEGIVTLKNVIAEVVGSIETDVTEDVDMVATGPGSYTVDGDLTVEEVEDFAGVKLPRGTYDTIAGLMITRLGALPSTSDKVQVGDVVLEAAEVVGTRVLKINLTVVVTG